MAHPYRAIHRMIDPLATSSIIEFARQVAVAHGLNVGHFISTMNCESNFNYLIQGDHGNSIGVAQIYLPAHPSITKSMAEDPYFSLIWAARQWQLGNAHLWSCWRILFA